jgi:hypothetical protein
VVVVRQRPKKTKLVQSQKKIVANMEQLWVILSQRLYASGFIQSDSPHLGK